MYSNISTDQNLDYQVTSIKLSNEGKKAIAKAFPSVALCYADENYDETEASHSPFVAFKNLCIFYCRQNQIKIDYQALNSIPERSMLESQVHRQAFNAGSSVSSPSVYAPLRRDESSRRKTFQQEQKVPQEQKVRQEQKDRVYREQKIDPRANHESPVEHDEPKITPHFIDLRFWGPKR